jgi:thiamine biosynthesis lipoprotein ApbE
MLADGLATVVMAMPVGEAIALLDRIPRSEGFVVSKDVDTIRTSGFPIME